MPTNNKKRRAIVSVTSKAGLVPFCQGLAALGFELVSTGGTAKVLAEAGLPVIDISQVTGHPEILGGRVKTLHPNVHGGILGDLGNPDHMKQMQDHDIQAFDLVCVNLYDFAGQALAKDLDPSEAIEFIDIGGPTLLRAAAKNHKWVLPVVDPSDYDRVLAALKSDDLTPQFRQELAAKVFQTTGRYDQMIASFLGAGAERQTAILEKVQSLRYGENPHQKASFWRPATKTPQGLAAIKVLGGKELSYNNYLDLDAAAGLAREFYDQTACVIVKHTNPCGVCVREPNTALAEVFGKALAGDPKSAFGGIVATTAPIDQATAQAISEVFIECIIAPAFLPEALEVFKVKKNLRLVEAPWLKQAPVPEQLWRSIAGGVLEQSSDTRSKDYLSDWRTVTKTKASETDLAELDFAMTVAKHVKSNAIVLTKNRELLAAGAGQMSRVDSAKFAISKAEEFGKSLKGAYLGSDAFFPFGDTVELMASHGIKAIVQPGGSVRDEDSIAAADKANVAMVFTGTRHFRH